MSKGRVAPSVPAEPYLLKRLRDPELAAAYLNAAAEEADPAAFMVALRRVTAANGGIASIAKRTGLNRQQLYKTLSLEGNPELRTFIAILGAAGYALHVIPNEQRRPATSRSQPTRIRKTVPRLAPKLAVARRAAVTS